MRKYLLVFVFCVLSVAGFAQTPSLQQKLYYTCKAWGFVKYYHSNVSTCHVNWDSVLVSVLPAVENATSNSAFNDALDTMLAAAGPMQLSTTYFPDTLPVFLKHNRDWSWMNTSLLRVDVQTQLDTIKNNFRPHAGCYVEQNVDYAIPNEGYLIFPDDDTELNVNTYTNYPDENHRLLALFKYWNVVRYFYPYNYVIDTPWDTTLYNYIVPIANVGDGNSFWLLYDKITTALNDAHVEGLTGAEYYFQPPGFWMPHILLKYVDSQYVVIKSAVTGIYPGDAIVSIDGLTTAQWEDSLRPYISAGNTSVFRRFMCEYDMLAREAGNATEALVVEDSNGNNHTVNVVCNSNIYYDAFFAGYYYPADSLNTISWTTMPCDIGYVNNGNVQESDVNQLYATLQNKSAIIFDIRNYPSSSALWDIANMMYPQATEFSKFIMPDMSYPGTYFWAPDSLGYAGNTTPYNGKVIILMDEETQSAAEFDCMILSAMPNVIRVGSQTAGADGDVSYWNLTQDLYAGMTTLGVFYPNGDSTQRIGIVPDSVVYPTRAGIRHHDDEVLDKALSIAGCDLSVSNITPVLPSVKVYPNPANDVVTIEGNNISTTDVTVSMTDVTGRMLLQKSVNSNSNALLTDIDVKALPAGMYIVTVKTGEQQYVAKVVKE